MTTDVCQYEFLCLTLSGFTVAAAAETVKCDYLLLRYDANEKLYAIVGYDERRHQLRSAMPGDHPPDGSVWIASPSKANLRRIAGLYPEAEAVRVYNELTNSNQGGKR